jgi:hypothetical protein
MSHSEGVMSLMALLMGQVERLVVGVVVDLEHEPNTPSRDSAISGRAIARAERLALSVAPRLAPSLPRLGSRGSVSVRVVDAGPSTVVVDAGHRLAPARHMSGVQPGRWRPATLGQGLGQWPTRQWHCEPRIGAYLWEVAMRNQTRDRSCQLSRSDT